MSALNTRADGWEADEPLGLRIGLSGLLAVLIPTLLLTSVSPPPGGSVRGEPLAFAALTGVIVIAGLEIARLLARGEPRLMEMTVWSFVYLFMAVAPIIQLKRGVDPSTTPNLNHELDAIAAAAVAVSSLSFILGRRYAAHRYRASETSTLGPGLRRTRLFAAAALVLGGLYVSRVGLAALFESRAALNGLNTSTWRDPGVRTLMVAVSTFPLTIAFLALSERRRLRLPKYPAGVIVFLMGSCALIVINPISSPRYYSGTVLLAMAAALGACASQRRVRVAFGAFLVGLAFVFPLADAFRNSSAAEFYFSPVSAFESGDFDAFGQLVNAFAYVDDRGITWGKQALGPAAFWIPRELWNDKPIDTGVLLAQYRGYDFENLSAPIWSEMYINGGWPAILLGSFLAGIFVGRFDLRSVTAYATGRPVPLATYILPPYFIILLRGSLLQATLILAVLVVGVRLVEARRADNESPRPRILAKRAD